MKAAILNGPGPLVIENVHLDAIEAGEVLVKIHSCGVCHSDLGVIQRATEPLDTPIVLGHEAAGTIESNGENVTNVKPGDHVIIAFAPSCGRCYYCVRGMENLCDQRDYPDRSGSGPRPRRTMTNGTPVMQGVGVGGFAEYTIMPEYGVIKIREDAPLNIVCLLGCGVTTGIGAAINTAKVEPGSSVAVIGLGGVGLGIVQGAKLAGASEIIAIDLVEEKLQIAPTFGATKIINATKVDAVEAVRDITSDRLDYAFEAIGLSKTVEQAFAMIRKGGTAVAVGVNRENISIPGNDFLREKKLIGSFYGSASVHADIPKLVDLYMSGKILLDEMVSRRRPLTEINEAFDDMKAVQVIRTIIDY